MLARPTYSGVALLELFRTRATSRTRRATAPALLARGVCGSKCGAGWDGARNSARQRFQQQAKLPRAISCARSPGGKRARRGRNGAMHNHHVHELALSGR